MAKHHKPATIFAAIFTLIQAIIWAVVAIYSCAIFECKLDFPMKPYDGDTPKSASLLFFTYLRGFCYSDTDSILWQSPAASRTYRWMIAYAVISCLWIPCAALLFGAAINNLRGKYILHMIYPWLFLTGVVLLCDLIAAIVYAIDISKTLTTEGYLEFIGFDAEGIPGLSGLSGVTVLPAVELTLFFSRLIVIFIINAVLFGVVIQVVRGIRKRSTISNYLTDDYFASTAKNVEEEEPTDVHGGGWVNSAYREEATPRMQPAREKFPLGPLPVVRIYDEPTFTRNPEEEEAAPPRSPPPDFPPPHRPAMQDEASFPVFDVSGHPLSWEQAAPERRAPIKGQGLNSTGNIDPTRPFTYLPSLPPKPKIHVSHVNFEDI